jgi:NADH-quinone oxidoreductase subunit N
MTLGNVMALWQNNIRRLLAYSSIAHAGYLLIGVAVALAAQTNPGVLASDAAARAFDGLGASMFYLGVYMFATMGAFAALVYLSSGKDRQVDTLDDIAGVNRRHPVVALAMTVFMFSLAGLPPLAGFWGKFALLFSALTLDDSSAAGGMLLRPWFIGLAVVTVLNAAIGAAYYLRVIGVMYFRAPHDSHLRAQRGVGPALAIFACLAVVFGVAIFPGRTIRWANAAGRALERSAALQMAGDEPMPQPAQMAMKANIYAP